MLNKCRLKNFYLRYSIFVLSIILCIFLGNVPVSAYFSIDIKNQMLCAVTPKHEMDPDAQLNLLLLSDNEEIQCNFNSSGHISKNDLLNLFYVDQLPFPEIIRHSKLKFNTHDFSIDNMIYANLRLSRLLDEYEDLRSRSEAVLEGLTIPFLEHQNEYLKPLDNEPSIAGTMDRLLNNYNLVSGQDQTNLIRQVRFLPSLNSHSRQAIGGRQFVTQHTVFNRANVNEQNNNSVVNNEPVQGVNEEENNEFSKSRGIQYGVSRDDQLPLILRFPLSLADYFFKNKIEAIIYLLTIYGIIHLIFITKK